ncbi:MAG TPA: type II secretion system protein GspN [Kofleriaceae bacterium]|nr:type II secretion system protein GspN [Kofleriaceae bacterium]
MNLGPRARVALKIAGYTFLALVTFVYAVHLTFPYERVRDKLVEALSSKYDVTVNGVERSRFVPGRFALTGVTLTSRPAAAGQTVTTMYFKRVEVDLKVLPLLGKRLVAGLDVRAGTGSMTGTFEQDGTTTIANFTLKRFPMANLPGISDAVGLPMDGNADGKLSMRLPHGDWTKAVGKFDLGCSIGCAVGDGVTKIYPKPQRPSDAALYRDGLTVPRIDIDRVNIGIDVAKGAAKLRSFELKSPAGEAAVDFNIKLSRSLQNSTIDGCIRYRCMGEFLQKYPGLCIGSPIVDEQGMLNIKLSGQVARMRRLPQRCEAGGGPVDSAAAPPNRPTLDTIPEVVEPTPAAGSNGPPTPMPPPPEPPPVPPVRPGVMTDDVGGSPPPPSVPSGGGSMGGSTGATGTTGSTGDGTTTPVPPQPVYTPRGGSAGQPTTVSPSGASISPGGSVPIAPSPSASMGSAQPSIDTDP